MAKSWEAKFNTRTQPEIKTQGKDFADIKAGEVMLISTPADVAAYIRRIPAGQTVDVKQMRRDLAAAAGADKTCPLTTSIFLRIVAERSLELMAAGQEPLAPFWRAIDPASSLAHKLSCGADVLRALRAAIG